MQFNKNVFNTPLTYGDEYGLLPHTGFLFQISILVPLKSCNSWTWDVWLTDDRPSASASGTGIPSLDAVINLKNVYHNRNVLSLKRCRYTCVSLKLFSSDIPHKTSTQANTMPRSTTTTLQKHWTKNISAGITAQPRLCTPIYSNL
jgi:hypothetical protein